MIDVTIDIRDLDATGSAPAHASVRFARLNPTSVNGTLVTAAPVPVPLTDGHGTIQLEAQTAYRVSASGIAGVRTSFAVLTGTATTTLADLWQTGQIDPGDYTAQPVPATVEQALAALASLYPAMRATPPNPATAVAYIDTSIVPPVLKGWNGNDWVPLGSSAPPPSAVVVESSSGGVLTLTGTGVTENSGVLTLTGSNVTENAGVITID